MFSAIVLIKARKDKAGSVRAILSARGFKANVVPGNFNVLAEIEMESENAVKKKIREAKKIDGVAYLETYPPYLGKEDEKTKDEF